MGTTIVRLGPTPLAPVMMQRTVDVAKPRKGEAYGDGGSHSEGQ